MSESSTEYMDDASLKRKRRFERVQKMKLKRSRNFISDCDSSMSSPIHSLESDPVLVRKLKNRESAERSRQKKNGIVDSLTVQVCDQYVRLSDLESENEFLRATYQYQQPGVVDSCNVDVVSVGSPEEFDSFDWMENIDIELLREGIFV